MMKRLLDIVLASIGLVIFLPFGIILAMILKFTGEGEIFFIQKRIGKGGKSFGLVKFATMLKDSPNIGTGVLTTHNDPRILPVGKFLRKTKLNEMPQLINIIKGDMSVVGPRPVALAHFEIYPERVKEAIKTIRPGLTGAGSIVFRDEEAYLARSGKSLPTFYREDIAPYKGELELWYVRNWSLSLDITIIFLTAWVVLFPNSKLHESVLKNLPPMPAGLSAQ